MFHASSFFCRPVYSANYSILASTWRISGGSLLTLRMKVDLTWAVISLTSARVAVVHVDPAKEPNCAVWSSLAPWHHMALAVSTHVMEPSCQRRTSADSSPLRSADISCATPFTSHTLHCWPWSVAHTFDQADKWLQDGSVEASRLARGSLTSCASFPLTGLHIHGTTLKFACEAMRVSNFWCPQREGETSQCWSWQAEPHVSIVCITSVSANTPGDPQRDVKGACGCAERRGDPGVVSRANRFCCRTRVTWCWMVFSDSPCEDDSNNLSIRCLQPHSSRTKTMSFACFNWGARVSDSRVGVSMHVLYHGASWKSIGPRPSNLLALGS